MGKNENCCRQCCLKTNHSEGKQISNSSSQNLTSSILDFTENRNHNRFWTKPDQKRKKKLDQNENKKWEIENKTWEIKMRTRSRREIEERSRSRFWKEKDFWKKRDLDREPRREERHRMRWWDLDECGGEIHRRRWWRRETSNFSS